jgi:hypothetical protein
MKQFLRFDEQSSEGKKTKTWHIFSTHSGDLLGYVSWENGWRQYVARSSDNIIWSVGCLRQLADFIEQQNIDHKKGMYIADFIEQNTRKEDKMTEPKPLIETHPTLWNKLPKHMSGDKDSRDYVLSLVKETTVDIAEHERVEEELRITRIKLTNTFGLLELKKENEHLKNSYFDEYRERWIKEGILEGDRRTKQQIRQKLDDWGIIDHNTHCGEYGVPCDRCHMMKLLGLEIEKPEHP